jgi:hypothetical protein
MDALSGGQSDLGARGDSIGAAICMDGDGRFIVNGLVRMGVVHPDEYIAAAPIDDILSFEPMEVIGGILAFLQIKQLLGIDLRILIGHIPVAVTDGNQGKAELIKVAETIVGDIPTQAAVPDFVIFMSFFFPFPGRKMAEGRQIAAMLPAHGLKLFQGFVDFGSLHTDHSFM